jgi:hypothetical protein
MIMLYIKFSIHMQYMLEILSEIGSGVRPMGGGGGPPTEIIVDQLACMAECRPDIGAQL